MRIAQNAYDFSATDRLGLALFTSILVHMVAILGVTFSAPRIRLPGSESLEITLVQTRNDKTPVNPQFLAQANQDGGGTSASRDIARSHGGDVTLASSPLGGLRVVVRIPI